MKLVWSILLLAALATAKPHLDEKLVEELEELTHHQKRLTPAPVDHADLDPLGPRQAANHAEGTVTVYVNGVRGSICSDGWDDTAATVVCREYALARGLITTSPTWSIVGRAVHGAAFGQASGPVLMTRVQCRGDEASVTHCPHTAAYTVPCTHANDAGVTCHITSIGSSLSEPLPPPPPGPSAPTRLHLEAGRVHGEGRVMVEYLGQIRPVCSDSWDHRDARVVCKELNYPDGEASSDFRYGLQAEVWMDEVGCSGLETKLEQCYHSGWGRSDCDGRIQAAGVKCHTGIVVPPPPPPPRDLIVQLSGSQFRSEGKVSIYYLGAYYDLCADNWGTNEATVVCRELGYTTGISLPNDNFGATSQLLEFQMVCRGSESLFSQCSMTPPGTMYCSSNKAATVRCDYDNPQAPVPRPPPVSSSDPRVNPMGPSRVLLVGPSQVEGLVYIQNQGTWGTICHINFDDLDATVLCKELGFTAGVAVPDASILYGRGMGTIWLNDLRCTGRELRIETCAHSAWGATTGCTHDQDVGIRCR